MKLVGDTQGVADEESYDAANDGGGRQRLAHLRHAILGESAAAGGKVILTIGDTDPARRTRAKR